LQQHARSTVRIGAQPQARRQLLGILEIPLQRLGQALAFDGHNALIALRAVVGFQGDGEVALADEIANARLAAVAQIPIAREPPHT
jgi:hypothetical protein